MGTLSLTVQKSTAEAIPYTVTIADEDIDRVALAYGSILFPQGIPVPQVVDEDGNVITPASVRAPNSTEIIVAISGSLIGIMMANVQTFESAAALAAAAASVAPISVTPGG